MKTIILLVALLSSNAMAGRLQDADHATLTQITSAGGTKANLLNDTKIYITANGINDQLSNAIVNGVIGGGGGGTKNYLTSYAASLGSGTLNTGNGDFERDTTAGFSLFHTTLTGVVPTGSITTGASSIGTFAATASTVLEKKFSLNVSSSGAVTAGQGFITDAFYIDRSDQNQSVTFSAKYSVLSGSSNLNLSGTTSNTFAVYLYDVTNSAWITPTTGVYSMTVGSGVGTIAGTVTTSATGAQYRLAVIAVNASSGASSINFDSFTFGPQSSIPPASTYAASYWVSVSFGSSNSTPVNFDSKDYDVANAVTVSSTAWKYTAPASGTYVVTVYDNPSGSSEIGAIYKNGTAYKAIGLINTAAANVMSGTIRLNANDFIDIRPLAGSITFGGSVTQADGNASNISIYRVGD